MASWLRCDLCGAGEAKRRLPQTTIFAGFYRFLNAISELPVPEDAGNFGLLDGNVAKEIAALTDRDRYFPGLRSWVGYRQIGVTVERLARYDNKPRVSMMGLFRLAKSAIFSFSSLPLTIFYLIAWLAFVMFASVAGSRCITAW